MLRELRDSFEVIKRDGVENFEQRLAVFVFEWGAGERKALRFADFLEDALHWISGSVRSAHVASNAAAGLHVHLAHGIGEAAGAPPARHVPGIRPSLEDEAARRTINTGKNEFLPGLASGGATCRFAHASSPWLESHLDSCAGDLAFSPTPCGSSRPSRQHP